MLPQSPQSVNDIAAALPFLAPELWLITTALVTLIVGAIAGRDTRRIGLIAAAGALLALLSSWSILSQLGAAPLPLITSAQPDETASAPLLILDRWVASFRVVLMAFLMAAIAVWGLFDAQRERRTPEFFTLLLASAVGMSLMASAANLLVMIVAIELASMPSFALAAFDRRRRAASEAGLKYVVFGAATSGFMYYGASLLYGLGGTLSIPVLFDRLAALLLAEEPALQFFLVIALLALLIGIGFKIAAVPFHFWCPDVFEGASLSVATWLSVASKAAGLVLLLRVTTWFCAPIPPDVAISLRDTLAIGVAILAIATITLGNLAAYRQTSIRRLLAYSSIAHAGYMLCLVVVPIVAISGGPAALSALIAYLAIYAVMNLAAFCGLGLVAADTGREDLSAFAGLGWRAPATAAGISVALLSLVGLPPFGGFLVKFWLIAALGAGTQSTVAPAAQPSPVGTAVLWTLVVVVVLNTAISLFYYARIIREMYLRPTPAQDGRLHAPLIGRILVAACGLILLLTGTVFADRVRRSADFAANSTRTAELAAGPL